MGNNILTFLLLYSFLFFLSCSNDAKPTSKNGLISKENQLVSNIPPLDTNNWYRFNLTMREKQGDLMSPHKVLISIGGHRNDYELIVTTLYGGKDFDGTARFGFESRSFSRAGGEVEMSITNSTMYLKFLSFTQRQFVTNNLQILFDSMRGCDLPISKVVNISGSYSYTNEISGDLEIVTFTKEGDY